VRRPLVIVLALSACGYRFTAPGGPLPQGIRAVQAPVFANVTPEPSAETYFTQALREQLIRAGTLGGEDADARIEGIVLGVSAVPMLATPVTDGGVQGRVPRPTYRLSATVLLKLLRGGAVVTQVQVTGEEDVLSGTLTPVESTAAGENADRVIAGSETNRQAGLRRLADALMREGYERLCTGW
jgi:hypothetical protein